MRIKQETEKEFCIEDPYNPGNVVSGILYRSEDKYGSLLIKEVNGEKCEQFIPCTPKFHYPGGHSSPKSFKRGLFPPFKRIRVYDKLDGTNIFMFKYVDACGNKFTSFKTRLVPFLLKAGFKDWLLLWGKILEKHHEEFERLTKADAIDGIGLAFEMFGSVNEILVKYNVPLDVRFLYGIDRNGMIVDPAILDVKIPAADLVADLSGNDDPDSLYLSLVDKYDKMFLDDKGGEGCVFYIELPDGARIAWKCKPLSVVAAQCQGEKLVGYDDAYTTCMNAMESVVSLDELGSETYALLAETYDEIKIEMSKERIDKAIKDARDYVLFKRRVVQKFEEMGLKWNGITLSSPKEAKGAIMRPMMREFKGANPVRVFNALLDHFSIFKT